VLDDATSELASGSNLGVVNKAGLLHFWKGA
jgi:hypothetical protein